jgi:hypothetical protein
VVNDQSGDEEGGLGAALLFYGQDLGGVALGTSHERSLALVLPLTHNVPDCVVSDALLERVQVVLREGDGNVLAKVDWGHCRSRDLRSRESLASLPGHL